MASPITIGAGSFSGNEKVIDFEAIAQSEEITTQYAGEGVIFSGGFYGFTGSILSLFFANPGSVVTANFVDTSVFSPVIIDFSSPVTRVGFDATTSTSDDLVIEAFSESPAGFASLGSFIFDTTLFPDIFVGLQDSSGINRVLISTNGP
ncbi:MAG: hypothetical protein HGA78_12235, partial [Nitrospirales bacterium]|nr:hypothetical protein [Nitrospirales bacterium]